MIESVVLRTPLISVPGSGGSIFLKPENLQRFGSYKIRGIVSAIRSAPAGKLKSGLSVASAGNMAQSVAFVAKELGISCRVYVPDTAPEVKKNAIRELGARLIERPFVEVWEKVRVPPTSEDEGIFIHPVDTPGLVEGYGKIVEEILDERPTVGAIVVPFGVGGLTCGILDAVQRRGAKVKVYACEPETAAPLRASLAAGRPTAIDRRTSFVDAIGTPEVLPRVFERVKGSVAGSLVVEILEIREALKTLALQHKMIGEGAAGAAFAAARRLARENPGLEIACILSGGNLPPETLSSLLLEK